jgi:hypothetical protein
VRSEHCRTVAPYSVLPRAAAVRNAVASQGQPIRFTVQIVLASNVRVAVNRCLAAAPIRHLPKGSAKSSRPHTKPPLEFEELHELVRT